MQRVIDDRCEVWKKIVKTMGKMMLAEDLLRSFLLWIDSVFSSLHLQRQIERHPRPRCRKADRVQREG